MHTHTQASSFATGCYFPAVYTTAQISCSAIGREGGQDTSNYGLIGGVAALSKLKSLGFAYI